MEKDNSKYGQKILSNPKDQYYLINREYVHKAIDHFTLVFKFYVVEMLKRAYGDQYLLAIANGPENDTTMNHNEGGFSNGYTNVHPDNWDFFNCFNVFNKFWDALFSKEHSNNSPKSFLFLIKHFRNQWAHNYSFSLRDAYRVADTVQLFFDEIQAPTDEINMIRLYVLDALFSEEKEKIQSGQTNSNCQSYDQVQDSNESEECKDNPNEDDSGGDSIKRHIQQCEKEESNEFTFSTKVDQNNFSFDDYIGESPKMEGNGNDSSKASYNQPYGTKNNGYSKSNGKFQRKIAISSLDDGSGSEGFESYCDM